MWRRIGAMNIFLMKMIPVVNNNNFGRLLLF
jgi:hypothetical protein